eukprot:SAG31_NODE_11987_length_980_cov_0.754824_1_plen_103_part_00
MKQAQPQEAEQTAVLATDGQGEETPLSPEEIIAKEIEDLYPAADLPVYDGVDRAQMLRRFVHCDEAFKKVDKFKKVDRVPSVVDYAVQMDHVRSHHLASILI